MRGLPVFVQYGGSLGRHPGAAAVGEHPGTNAPPIRRTVHSGHDRTGFQRPSMRMKFEGSSAGEKEDAAHRERGRAAYCATWRLLARRRDGGPGAETIWRGLDRVRAAADTLRALGEGLSWPMYKGMR